MTGGRRDRIARKPRFRFVGQIGQRRRFEGAAEFLAVILIGAALCRGADINDIGRAEAGQDRAPL